jgi:hypothetical protein
MVTRHETVPKEFEMIAGDFKYVSPSEVVLLAQTMMNTPDIFTIFEAAQGGRDFSPDESRTIFNFLENYRQDYRKNFGPDYGYLSAAIVLLRECVEGGYSGLDDPLARIWLKKILPKK